MTSLCVYWLSQEIATMKITCWIHSLQCCTPSLGYCVGNLSGGSCEGGSVSACIVGGTYGELTCHALTNHFLCVGKFDLPYMGRQMRLYSTCVVLEISTSYQPEDGILCLMGEGQLESHIYTCPISPII